MVKGIFFRVVVAVQPQEITHNGIYLADGHETAGVLGYDLSQFVQLTI